jgi:single-strand DNA-binding protein
MGDGLNKVMLIGNIGQDPELRETQGGQAVLNIRLATNESWVDKDGERKDRTEWHTLVMWGKRADSLYKHLSKGEKIYVEGRLQTRSWEDKEGNKRYSTEVNLSDLKFLGGKGQQQQAPQASKGGFGDDDIPF